MHTNMNTYTHTYHVQMHTHAHMNTCTHTHTCTHAHTHMHTHTCTHIHARTCTHAHTCTGTLEKIRCDGVFEPLVNTDVHTPLGPIRITRNMSDNWSAACRDQLWDKRTWFERPAFYCYAEVRSQHITSHRITSHRIASHRIATHRIRWVRFSTLALPTSSRPCSTRCGWAMRRRSLLRCLASRSSRYKSPSTC